MPINNNARIFGIIALFGAQAGLADLTPVTTAHVADVEPVEARHNLRVSTLGTYLLLSSSKGVVNADYEYRIGPKTSAGVYGLFYQWKYSGDYYTENDQVYSTGLQISHNLTANQRFASGLVASFGVGFSQRHDDDPHFDSSSMSYFLTRENRSGYALRPALGYEWYWTGVNLRLAIAYNYFSHGQIVGFRDTHGMIDLGLVF